MNPQNNFTYEVLVTRKGLEDLEDQVNAKLGETPMGAWGAWQISGGVSVVYDGQDFYWAQAMLKHPLHWSQRDKEEE